MDGVSVKFVSQKINKIRWKPSFNPSLQDSKIFGTGNWDDLSHKLSIWTIDDGLCGSGEVLEEPRLLCDVDHVGDVTDLLYLANDMILTSSSFGNVTLHKHHTKSQTLSLVHSYPHIHHYSKVSCSCTALAHREDDVVSVGEDGRFNFLNMEQKAPVRTIDNADSCTINDVAFLKKFEIATTNSAGQLKVWDVREGGTKPCRTLLLTGDTVPLHCVDKHPGQPHVLATGGQDGMLCIWDLRQDKYPATLLNAHSGDMWEVRFHPSYPDNLFTCSEDGSVWQWDVSMIKKTLQAADVNPWLCINAAKQKMDISSLIPENIMPVNTIDIVANILLCGTDGEAIHVIKNVIVN